MSLPPSPLSAVSIPLPTNHSKRYSSASSRAGDRSLTDPDPMCLRIKKRIIDMAGWHRCQGTLEVHERAQARKGNQSRRREIVSAHVFVPSSFSEAHNAGATSIPPRPQVVFYQSGVGSEPNAYYALLDGATGASLGDKVQEAYAFIAHNYEPGDEIYLFGFSRGAYTARMVATMIGKIGVLDRTEMDNFADIFVDLQKRGKTKDKDEIAALDERLSRWTHHNSPGKIRADFDDDTFSVKCIGVFDTVGSLGLPEELSIKPNVRSLFGFPDSALGEHIERAYQALALNETRADFNCNKFHMTKKGMQKKQILRQTWFAGSHSDIGGGFEEHDLSDLTLIWMAAQVGDILSLDLKYLVSLLKPNAPWGQQEPHDSISGVFKLADTIQRKLPVGINPVTHETVHSSVLQQDTILPQLKKTLDEHPDLLAPLLPLEEELKVNWHFSPDTAKAKVQNAHGNKTAKLKIETTRRPSLVKRTKERIRRMTRGEGGGPESQLPPSIRVLGDTPKSPRSPMSPQREKNWFIRISEERSFSAFVREITSCALHSSCLLSLV
ncbi:hypothetical protein EWM64_g1362 [Hericium alpestre]|uniref:T6SS Phospholipase effector Tle1-like catalytic domain-containing protein n=1 Tax=Hericium alpestre TaxID=135208 RepID=A0A4Z0A8P3_9AGAM|nr:hypothetical protein EWM64_g1362 [Hericium alpestre]